jgi:hypothetical protein
MLMSSRRRCTSRPLTRAVPAAVFSGDVRLRCLALGGRGDCAPGTGPSAGGPRGRRRDSRQAFGRLARRPSWDLASIFAGPCAASTRDILPRKFTHSSSRRSNLLCRPSHRSRTRSSTSSGSTEATSPAVEFSDLWLRLASFRTCVFSNARAWSTERSAPRERSDALAIAEEPRKPAMSPNASDAMFRLSRRRMRKPRRRTWRDLLVNYLPVVVLLALVGAILLMPFYGHWGLLMLLSLLRDKPAPPPLAPADIELFPWEYRSIDDPSAAMRKKDAWNGQNGAVSTRSLVRSVIRTMRRPPRWR